MDPLTLTVLLALAGYCVAAPDRRTLTASRGATGAVRSGAVGGARQIRKDWRDGAPARKATHKRWRDDLNRSGWMGALAVVGWDCLRFTGKAGRGATRYGYRAGKAAGREGRSGYRTAAANAAAKRAAKRPTPTPPLVEEKCRPTPESPSPTRDGSTPAPIATGDPMNLSIKPRELTNTGDLRGENGELRGILEELREVLAHLNEYLTGVGDRYAGAPFGTAKLSRAITGLGEQAKAVDPAVADHILEQVEALEEALTEAESLGEHSQAVEAEGEIHAFQPA